jgi:hypothetical protein
MIKHASQLSVAVATGLALSLSAFADVKVNDNISVNGYVVGAYTHTKLDGVKSTNTFLDSGGFDAAKLGVLATGGSISAYGSILHLPGAANEAGLLDAYATLDMGNGTKLTGGKFLSYLGYEAFDPINMAQLSYGSTIFAVPAYHTGAKIDYTGKGFTLGFAAVDSVFPGAKGFFEGDREFDDTIGYELIGTYTGIDKLTVFAGIATENIKKGGKDVMVYDLWASYALSSTVTIAGEVDKQDDVGEAWLAFLSYKSSDQVSTAFRVSGISRDNGMDDMRYTIAPTYTINANLSVRAELSMLTGDSGDGTFFGVQALLKF